MQGNKVLIIDDDSKNIFALKATLRSRRFEAVSATNAADGIHMIEQDAGVGVVLMDMMMPDMDGYEAIRQLKSGAWNRLPLIAVTAQAMVGDREKCLEAGADHYIAKPIDVDALMALLHKYVSSG